jgi:N-succinyldiaminopimelate aminotransferase
MVQLAIQLGEKPMTYMAQRVTNFGTTVFAEMTSLANHHRAVNLGQGFPDFAAPDFLKSAAVRAINDNVNQYAPSTGISPLRRAIARKMERWYGLPVNPDKGIVVTHGATEAIFAAIMGLTDPGDEVILFEPYYDSYVPSVQMAGGTPRFYTLTPPEWSIDRQKLAALFNEKSKLVLINTPHNPTGKLFSHEELAFISELCRAHDVIAITDEVYEHIRFDGLPHYCLATFPGMAERTVTISSLGKTFSVTGWKVGWAIGAPELAQAVIRGHQFITFCGAAPLQEAALAAFAADDTYYDQLSALYQKKRDFLIAALQNAGLQPITPCGTYFIMVDIGNLNFADDVAFCRHLTQEIGVAAIPPSAFYQDPRNGAQLARFAFCKSDETLNEAGQRLLRLASSSRDSQGS